MKSISVLRAMVVMVLCAAYNNVLAKTELKAIGDLNAAPGVASGLDPRAYAIRDEFVYFVAGNDQKKDQVMRLSLQDGRIDKTSIEGDLGSVHSQVVPLNNALVAFMQSEETLNVWASSGPGTESKIIKSFPMYNVSGIDNVVTINNKVFFKLKMYNPSVTEPEIWVTDSTVTGTYKITLSDPDAAIAYAAFASVKINGVGYMALNSQDTGVELWRTDGVSLSLVGDMTPGTGATIEHDGSVTALGDKLYFVGPDKLSYNFWSSDGTVAGSGPALALNNSDYIPMRTKMSDFFNVEGRFYFIRMRLTGGAAKELWSTDGTQQGTRKVFESSVTGYFETLSSKTAYALGDKLAFVVGSELYADDGVNVTKLVEAPYFIKEPSIFQPDPKTGRLYFTMFDENSELILAVTDGTKSGTTQIKKWPGHVSSTKNKVRFAAANNTVYFSFSNPQQNELWKVDGSKLDSLGKVSFVADNNNIKTEGEKLYFTGDDGIHGKEPWVSDGTVAGTRMLSNTVGDYLSQSSDPTTLMKVDNSLFFIAKNSSQIWTLYRSENDGAAPAVIHNFTSGEYPLGKSVVIGKKMNFVMYAPNRSEELWWSDGATVGVQRDLQDAGTDIELAVLGENIIHAVKESNGLVSLYAGPLGVGLVGKTALIKAGASDETAMTKIVLNTSLSNSKLQEPGAYLYFKAVNHKHGIEIWRTNGTVEGTSLVSRIGERGLDVGQLTTLGDKLIFTLDTAEFGNELYVLNGQQPSLIRDINTGRDWSDPVFMGKVNGRLLFSAHSGDFGRELWSTDGTTEGTVQIKDANPGQASGIDWRDDFIVYGNKLFFVSLTPGYGKELWVSDGTSAGTLLVKDLNVGAFSGQPGNFVEHQGSLHFSAFQDGAHIKLWKSDGTDAGTTPLAFELPAGSNVYGFKSIAGNLSLVLNDQRLGYEPWVLKANKTPSFKIPAAQTLTVGKASAAFPLQLADLDDGLSGLNVTFSSDNPTVVPPSSLVASGSIDARILTITPAKAGKATIFIVVSDGESQTKGEFVVTANDALVETPPPPANTGGGGGGGGGIDPFYLLLLGASLAGRRKAA